jgi:hypothetical protein
MKSVGVGTGDTVRVRHFEPDAARAARPNLAAGALTIDDVVEASRDVSPSTLEAAILESRSRFPLSGRTLVALSEQGVPASVTDLMVAVTFPEEFRVARMQPDDRVALFDSYPYYGGWNGFSPWGSFYDPYFYSPYFYSPFGYSYLGAYPRTIIVTGVGGGVGGGAGGGGDEGGRSGRVVNGLGYTRVESRGAPAEGSGARPGMVSGSGGRVTPQGFTSGGSSGGSSSAGDSGDSGGSSSGGGGSSSGGSSDGGGRTAVPR